MDLMNQYKCPRGSQGRQVAKLMNQEHQPLTKWGLTKVKIAPDSVILDVGCGGGKTVNLLAQLAPDGKVFGIDQSSEMVAYSKKVNKKLIDQNRVEIIETTVEKMDFPDNFFNLVTACEVYYFWPILSDALKEINRVLKPLGGLLLINEMVQDGLYEVENSRLIELTHVRLIPLEQIRDVMQSIGFLNIQIYTLADSPWNAIFAQKPLE